jgi:hypothetical protein
MKIEMSGKEDRQGPWKFAIAGAPGSGKTMLSSTAPDPLYAFFQQEPRIKSVADRAIQHVKLVNDFQNNTYAIDQMYALVMFLELGDHPFKTFVVDTGDEFFQQMKAGRTHQNGGEFNIGDWSWIGDNYREVMLGIIDLPMNIIVNFHVRSATDEEHTFKEFALQGAPRDEAAGWFDIVGALDTYTVVDDHGESITKRVLLTGQSRTYPWVKDHSGAIPARFEISPHFTDDIPRLLELAQSHDGIAAREVVGEVPKMEAPVVETTSGVPSPEDLDAKKLEAHEVPTLGGEQSDTDKHDPGYTPAEPLVSPVEQLATATLDKVPEPQPEVEAVAPIDTQDTQAPVVTTTNEDPLTDGSASVERVPASVDSQADVESAMPDAGSQPPDEAPVSDEQALAAVTEELGAVEVFVCTYEDPETGEKCGIDLSEDETLRDMTQIRFRQWLCRPHFKFKIDEINNKA